MLLRGQGERGAVLVIVALLLVVLIGVAALVFDMGQLFTVRRELQNTVDAASLAGALQFDGTEAGIDRAREQVRTYARSHLADHRRSEIPEEDIIFGSWDPASRTFTPYGPSPSAAQFASVNAVRVEDRRAGESAVMLRLAPVLGRRESDVGTAALAITGGPSSECVFPMVVPDCSLKETLESGDCEHCFVYQDHAGRPSNSAWSTFDSHPGQGVPHIRDLVAQGCFDENGNPAIDAVTGTCAGQCIGILTGEEAEAHTGNMMSQGASNFCPLIQALLLRDGTGTPQPFTVTVPVLETSGVSCEVPNRGRVAGFAALQILGARCGNNDAGVFVETDAVCGEPPSGKILVGRLLCDLESDRPPGGGHFGIESRRVILGQ